MPTRDRSASLDTPVLVVGAGPVGSVLALELARHGVACVVVERATTASRHPKMDFINARSMELLRRLDLTSEIRARGVGGEHPFNFVWTRDPDEPPISVWRYPSVDELAQRIDASDDGTLPQVPYQRLQGSLLEEVVRRRAGEHPLVDLREGWTFTGLEQHAGGVVARVTDPAGAERRIAARYLVACDGANSAVRREVGIAVQQDGPTTQHCDLFFRSADPLLRRHGRAFLTITTRGLTLVSRDERDTWTGTFLVGEGDEDVDPVERVQELLGAPFEVEETLSVARWEGRLSVAESYRAGSVFLAGDAAHQFYPTGGHGANTGLADAVDLGWKLAATLQGWGGPALLDSYEPERRPVALFNREMCANLLEVWLRYFRMGASGVSRAHIAGFLDKDSYQIDNLGIHCGYRYESSPIVVHEKGEAPEWRWQSIVPTTWPGGRPPSVRLDDGSWLFDRLGTGFTLVDFSGKHAGADMAEEGGRRGIPMTYLPVGDAAPRACWERNLVLVRPDQHVAWRGHEAPEDPGAILDQVRGGRP